MAPSSPTTTKLRRSATLCSGDHDVEKGEARIDEDLRVPLMCHPTPLLNHPTTIITPVYAWRASKLKGALACCCLFSLLVLAAPWIYWIGLYFVGPNIPDATCPIQEWLYPDCHEHLTHKQGDDITPMVSPEQWVELRRKYQETVGVSSLAKGWDQQTKRITKDGDIVEVENNGFLLPVEFRYATGKGRGVYATQRIAKGQQIWDSRFRGIFDNECSARMFFTQLTNDEQCQIMFWGYNNNFYGNGFQFMTSLDGHSYLNHCPAGSKCQNAEHHFEGELETRNYRLPHFFSLSLGRGGISASTFRRRNKPGSHGLYASRDILPGEEICFDYTEIQVNAIFDYYTLLFTHSLQVHQWATM